MIPYCRYVIAGLLADPVHFRPDPDPANQTFENRIRIPDLNGTSQEHQICFLHITHLLIFE